MFCIYRKSDSIDGIWYEIDEIYIQIFILRTELFQSN